ncbi:MAG TPA: AraC family transcriptional regulator [Rudaea sp.]|jgi:AraC family transcriptional regulator|nr:AraC family transcriptional regulator [Rudaea sp.]
MTLHSTGVVVVFIQNHELAHGSNLVLSVSRSDGQTSLQKVVGGGRGCALRVDGPVAGIWIPLRGRLQLITGDGECSLRPGELRVTEPEARVQAVGRGNAVWIALLGNPQQWTSMLRRTSHAPQPDPILLPARHLATRDTRRRAIALARAMANGSLDAASNALIDSVMHLQSEFAEAIARCPGRTFAQRRHVFLRLQRVRNYLASNCHLELNNLALARMANYSPWHFIRAFRAAYAETPHALLVNLRLQRARELLKTSPLAIAKIALASGFENRCAFSRLFHQRFGVTAGAMRRQLQNPTYSSA